MAIVVKSRSEIEHMRRAGKILAEVLDIISHEVRVGIKTRELDDVAARELERLGAKPSFLGYRGFPSRLCVSVNDEIVHGIPGDRVVKDGDIVSLDVGDIVDGFQADVAITVGVGKVSAAARDLMDAAQGSLKAGIGAARKGNRLGDVSAAIQSFVEARGFSVVREYTGHGIGRDMHEDPQVPNFGTPGQGILLVEGMTLALEPMVNQGAWRTKVGPNRWTVSTVDGGLSAHFEHTIAITAGEAEILTVL